MENYSSTNDTYVQRMNQTAKSKFAVVESFLSAGVKILDFGSGISPEFISDVDSTGAEYYAYDISPTVQTELSRMGVNVVTKKELIDVKIQFDIIYLSSVFHEIISYLNHQERTETIAMIMSSLKPGGHLIIRDWANPDDANELFTLQPVSKQAKDEMNIWIHELKKNSIIEGVNELEDCALVTNVKNAYEILFHTVWGLKSLSRESQECYNVTKSIYQWIYSPWEHILHKPNIYLERDDSYLPHLQKYFKLDSVPFNTKMICIFEKQNNVPNHSNINQTQI